MKVIICIDKLDTGTIRSWYVEHVATKKQWATGLTEDLGSKYPGMT